MSTSAIASLLDALVDNLSAVSALQGVVIMSGAAGPEIQPEQISLGLDCTIEEARMTMGGNKMEEITVPGDLYVEKAGADEDTIREARDRAVEIFAAVETYLNDYSTIGGTVVDATLSLDKLSNVMSATGRVCVVEFTIYARAAKNP